MASTEHAISIRPALTTAQFQTLRKYYPDLDLNAAETGTALRVDGLSSADRIQLEWDLEFLAKNPNIALENICNRLGSWPENKERLVSGRDYIPQNQSQEELLSWARKLAGWGDFSQAAGLFVQGPAGIGKTHISIALAKEFMARGFDARYVVADNLNYYNANDRGPNQAWVIDDLNSGYGTHASCFLDIVLNAAQKGGIVFVTSNSTYGEIIARCFGYKYNGEAELMKYRSRTGAMFKLINVAGTDRRQATAWHTQV
ncbi:MAG: ATP-binding protein [DPANN group archaeon]|nr:ATP-binding protein [DPANN group archaeon]